MAHADRNLGRLEEAKRLLENAEATFEATRDREGLIDTAEAIGRVFRIEGRPVDAARRYAKMLRLNRGDKRTEVQALHGLVDSRTASGRLEDIDPLVQRMREAALATGDTRRIAKATFVAGLVRLALKDFEDAEKHFHTTRALSVTVGDYRLQIESENNLGETLRLKGEIKEAERVYEGVARFAEENNWSLPAAIAHLNLTIINLSREDPSFARIHLDQAEAHIQNHPKHWAWLVIGLIRAGWAAESADENTCRAWWSVAIDRGLGRIISGDLVEPLSRVASAAERNGWNDIASRAVSYREAILHTPSNGASEGDVDIQNP